MNLFAHGEVEHATTGESLSHSAPQIILLSVAFLFAIYVVGQLLSTSAKENPEDDA